jgi:alcohol dehydrogenase
MQLFQQQYRIFGSFGFTIRNVREALRKIARGVLPVIDSELDVADFEQGLARLDSRRVFGKIVVRF